MAEKANAPLDDMMMAMDVVDTLRHDEALVSRELGAERRDSQMIERLREIYTAQGIDVPDHILVAGVEGLKEDRFVYAPPSSGPMRLLALVYINRLIWSKWVTIVVVACVILFAGWQYLIVGPRENARQSLAVELSEEIPATLTSLQERISELTSEPVVLADAERIADNGRAAAEDAQADAARKAVSDLRGLSSDLAAIFEVRIVSRPGIPTGVTRIPDVNQDTSNYYLVVEAIGPDGAALERSIISEEDGKIKTVTQWAQRVPKATFDKVRDDKAADGIVQKSLLGMKSRGQREIDWTSAVEEGAITSW